MHEISAYAVRVSKKTIEVTISGQLNNSCHKAEIVDHYPGGSIVHIVDPGAAQVFVEEIATTGDVKCGMALVPWSETVSIPDKTHSKVEIYLNGKEVLEVPVFTMTSKFIVIALTGTMNGLSIIPEKAKYAAIYSQVFGPASYEKCKEWVSGQSKGLKSISKKCNLALNAIFNEKEKPNKLIVHGSVMVYTRETEVILAEADSPSIVPDILLLKLTINEKPGAMKGMPRPFSYEDTGSKLSKYKQVQVISNQGDDCITDIFRLG